MPQPGQAERRRKNARARANKRMRKTASSVTAWALTCSGRTEDEMAGFESSLIRRVRPFLVGESRAHFAICQRYPAMTDVLQ